MNNLFITGGTGSFGQAYVDYLFKSGKDTNLNKIIIYSRDEHKQELMSERFKSIDKEEKLRYLIGDIRDKDRLQLAINGSYDGMLYIIHAAALKVVPTAEYNPQETIKTNIFGSQNLINACLNAWGKGQHIRLIALSTDKAVSPVNLYGATKLAMEKMMIAANNVHGELGPKFAIVRYGNVANSNGSVIQVFKRQIQNKEPLTITDENMSRFWITLDEATEFVYNCFFHKTLEPGKIYIPDMPSFNVISLAQAMGGFDYELKFTGVRPGEKIHEQIDIDKFSNTNSAWLLTQDLKEKIQDMGII